MSVSDHCRDELSGIKLDDLQGDVREFAEYAGLDPALKLLELFSGGRIYLPKVESVARERRNKLILGQFNGNNYGELSKTFRLSRKQIRNITAMKQRVGS